MARPPDHALSCTTDPTVSSVSRHARTAGRRASVLLTVALTSSLVAGCSSQGDPAPSASPEHPSLAACRSYGVAYAPVNLKLPGLRLWQTKALPARTGREASLALRADNGQGADREAATMTASLFDGPAMASSEKEIRSGMWIATDLDAGQWGEQAPDGPITLTRVADNGQATDISHSTFVLGSGERPITFDYWVFTANDHRYTLSYSRTAKVKTPDAAAFFASATSCPKSTIDPPGSSNSSLPADIADSRWTSEQRKVIDGYEGFNSLMTAISTKAEKTDLTKAHRVATEPFATSYLKGVEATLSAGYEQAGKPGITVSSATVTGNTATMKACLDLRWLDLTNPGNPSAVREESRPPSEMTVSLVRRSGSWLVAGIKTNEGPCITG